MGTDMRRDLRTRGCPVCDHLEDALLSFLARWQHDLAREEKARKVFAEECGFCPTHLWQLAAFSSPRGLASGFPPLLSHLADVMHQAAEDSRTEGPAPPGKPGEDCRVCGMLRDLERSYISHLAGFLGSEEGRSAYDSAQGVCLRHLRLLVQCVGSGETVDFLLRKAACRFREIEASLRSYGQKLESLRRHDATPEEKDADRRALVLIAGARNLSFPFR
jgi:hypothetical protein